MSSTNPLSWRDVYHAVEQSEGRIVERIEKLEESISPVLSDHEERIRSCETANKVSRGIEAGVKGTLKVQHVILMLVVSGSALAVSLFHAIFG